VCDSECESRSKSMAWVTQKQRECKCGVAQCGGGARVIVGFMTKTQTMKNIMRGRVESRTQGMEEGWNPVQSRMEQNKYVQKWVKK